MKRSSTWITPTLILALFGAGAHPGLASNTRVIFTEIMTGPNDAGFEWVEVYNLTDQDIDLSGWVFDDAATGFVGPTEANIVSGVLPAGGTAVLYDDRAGMTPDDMRAVWGTGINFVPVIGENHYWPYLDTSDTIGLWDSHAAYIADNPGVDRVFSNAVTVLEYGDKPPWPRPGPQDIASSIYLTDLNDPANGEKWAISRVGDEGIVESSQLLTTNAANLGIVPAGTPSVANLVITEIYYNPVGSNELPYECIEVYNNTGAAIDFSATPWVIDDCNSSIAGKGGPNITEGVIGAGEVAVLYNALTPEEVFAVVCPDPSVNKIPVANWAAMGLNNGGDKISLWDDYAEYVGNHQTHAGAKTTIEYTDDPPWPVDSSESSIYLTHLGSDPTDGTNWMLSSPMDGLSYSIGPAHQVGSPGRVDVGGGSGEDPLPGDLNGDGYVNSSDLDVVRANWGRTVPQGDLGMGDPSGDGIVGGADLDIIRANWGAGARVSVPEPCSALLLILAAACPAFALARSRRWSIRPTPPPA